MNNKHQKKKNHGRFRSMVFIGYCHRGVKGPSPAEKGPRHPHWTSPPVIDVVAARGLDEGRLAWWRSIVSAV